MIYFLFAFTVNMSNGSIPTPIELSIHYSKSSCEKAGKVHDQKPNPDPIVNFENHHLCILKTPNKPDNKS